MLRGVRDLQNGGQARNRARSPITRGKQKSSSSRSPNKYEVKPDEALAPASGQSETPPEPEPRPAATVVVELPPPADRVDDPPFPGQARCALHRFEPLLWYCATCRASLCTICRIGAHEQHETMSFEAITAPTARRLAQLQREADTRLATLERINVARMVERLSQSVDAEVLALDQRLVRRCEDIKQDVRDRTARMRAEIDREMETCKEYRRQVEECIEVLACINVGEEPSQHPLFVSLMNGHISCSHFLRAAAPVDQYQSPRIVDSLRLLELPISNTLEACRKFDWTALSVSNTSQLYPRADAGQRGGNI